jgi:hypothetical protein
MNRIVSALLLAAGISSLAPSCRYQNVNAVGNNGKPAPYTNLQCFGTGNAEGFSVEVPSCDCASGIRLIYRVNKNNDGSIMITYEMERGFLKEDNPNVTRMVSRSPDSIDEIFIGQRKLPLYAESKGFDRELWDSSREIFKGMWDNYEPQFPHFFRVCTEDQLDKKVRAMYFEE